MASNLLKNPEVERFTSNSIKHLKKALINQAYTSNGRLLACMHNRSTFFFNFCYFVKAEHTISTKLKLAKTLQNYFFGSQLSMLTIGYHVVAFARISDVLYLSNL